MATQVALREKKATSTVDANVELIAAPGAGKAILVTKIYVSAGGTQIVDLEAASTMEWRQYVGPNGGSYASGPGEEWRCGDNEALTYSTSAAVGTFIAVNYRIEDA